MIKFALFDYFREIAGIKVTITRLEGQICEKEIKIESLTSQVQNYASKQNPGKAPEKHWVIESNLRDRISELKQKLLTETNKNSKLEQESIDKSELLVKAKVIFDFLIRLINYDNLG